MNLITQMLRKDFVAIGIVASVIGLLAAILFRIEPLGVFSATVLFAGFDCIGYYYLLTRDGTIAFGSLLNAYYRLLETAFQITLSILLLLAFGLIAFLSFWILYYCGLDDFLYYILLKQPFWTEENMTWLDFTVFGIALEFLNKPITWKWMVGFSTLAIVLTLLAGIAK